MPHKWNGAIFEWNSDSRKPSVISTICNLSSLKICVSGCELLALIRLDSAFVSSMKTRYSESNPSTDIVIMETGNFLRFITPTLHSLLSVPFPESLSYLSDIFWSSPLEIPPLTSRDFASFPKNYSVSWHLRYSLISCPIFLQ